MLIGNEMFYEQHIYISNSINIIEIKLEILAKNYFKHWQIKNNFMTYIYSSVPSLLPK